MKKGVLALLLAGFAWGEVDWATSYERGLAQAKEEQKLVMVMFSKESCKACAYMKKEVFERPQVARYLDEHYVAIEVDIHDYPKTMGYKVIGTPTFYFLAPDGTTLGSALVGKAPEKLFLDELRAVKASYIKH